MTDQPVAAYRRPEEPTVLFCRVHGRTHADWRSLTPLVSEDLPDGGFCSECYADVLIPLTGDGR
ncbi:hypothetical protein N4G70_29130 [Streptomyces sp. ASQP_92]|uniref:hypothetical protein n=1 Tax=Streptomyces sp. ASQP_92 TaxID=2979116 RepID=UPI0021BE572F|nr:hypothetical protein [Streptomyces sp. ASQP_92]MCT9092905.1 hypothetical protein [Streptomyces sp. ASQP_92]